MTFKTNSELFNKGHEYLMQTYSRLPVLFERARGQYLWDFEGNKYLDFIAGYGCLNVGHTNKFVINAVKRQIKKIIQSSNLYYNEPQVLLAKKLCEVSEFGQKVFFANSGTESIEGAIKLARKYSTDNYNSSRYEIITFKKAFHGRTLGALAATAQEDKQKLYEPLLSGFKYAELNDIKSVEDLINENTCAVMIEPVQGEGGVYPSNKEFLINLRKICTQKNILLVLDEIQTGFGRTGSIFAYKNFGIYPDVLVLAKSLGGGMPIGAIITTEVVARSFGPGSHGSTFGGNAASCVAGIAAIDYIINNKLCEKAKNSGKYFMDKLIKIKEKYPVVKEVRGMGLMIGMEFNEPVTEKLVLDALNDRIVINRVSSTTLRFLPSLIINKKNIDVLIKWLDKKIKEI